MSDHEANNPPSRQPKRFDVLVVGAGPAGCAAAQVLAKSGQSVLVIEQSLRHHPRIGETVPPVANDLLRKLGVFPNMATAGHLPSFSTKMAWGSEQLISRDFMYEPFGHGWQLDRRRFERDLADAARRCGAKFVYATGVSRRVERRNGSWQVCLASPKNYSQVQCKWIVDATGRSSAIARALGARRKRIDELVCEFTILKQSDQTAADHDASTLVESCPNSWWYTARIPNGRRVVAWLTDADILRSQSCAPQVAFANALANTTHLISILKSCDYRTTSHVHCKSACSSRLDPWVGDGWVTVGDSAFSLDPLSSQGIFHALASAIVAAEAIIDSGKKGTNAIVDYCASLEQAWSNYKVQRRDYYRVENRWPNECFWKRRQE